MNITIGGHKGIHELAKDRNVLMLNDPGNENSYTKHIKEVAKDFLYMEFYDTVRDGSRDAPTEYHVARGLEWGKNKDDLICACMAGRSRSSAFAYLLWCTKMSPKEAIAKLDINIHTPNCLIVKYGTKLLDDQAIFREYVDYRQRQDARFPDEIPLEIQE